MQAISWFCRSRTIASSVAVSCSVKRGGRFVEDQQANLFIQRLGDLHQLLLTKAEVADAGIGGNGQIDLRQQFLTAQRHGFIIQQTMAGDLGAEENILQHGEMFHQRQLPDE